MTFVDPLAIMLIGLAMGTAIGAFYFYFAARGNKEQIQSLIYPAIGIGLFDFISGFYMSFAWPMTGFGYAYNMLFGDPLLMFGLLLMISAIMVYKDMHLGLMPILALLLGIYVLDGAYSIVTLHLEKGNDLITAMGLYIFDGIGAILAPIAYLKPQANSANKYLYYLEWIILGIGTIFALVIGYMALNGHLASPP
jgi:putative membrane protein